jgi:hypothetical protein
MTKAIIFDASSLISMSMNGLLPELEALKKVFGGHFLIPKDVEYEAIERPIGITRFALEGLRLKELYKKGVLESPSVLGIDEREIALKTSEMEALANNMFSSSRGKIKLIHKGETACLALSRICDSKMIKNAICIDERTTRMLVEKPENLKDLLERKMHTKVKLGKREFGFFRDFRIIRSTEMIYIAWKKDLVRLKDGKKVLEALMWALRFKGCSISHEEIKEIVRI